MVNEINKNRLKDKLSFYLVISIFFIFLFFFLIKNSEISAAIPQGPDSVSVVSNSTKGNVSAYMINISGGVISKLNISATVQNRRWKAFVGWVTGKFTLDDAAGKTIYDWSLAIVNGRVYATRNSSYVEWSYINCSNKTHLEAENVKLSHTNINDNLTATFKDNTHKAFTVASILISANSCPTLNTYVNDSAQDNYFEEVVLYDGYNIVYAALLEQDRYGYDENTYDFQMIVPENGSSLWTGSIPYYLYVELD